jgi:hypothetical protein
MLINCLYNTKISVLNYATGFIYSLAGSLGLRQDDPSPAIA